MLTLVPIDIRDAQEFVVQHHRHHGPTQGAKFAIACAAKGEVVGVALVGRPVSRLLDDGWTVEVTRVAVLDGIKNANSFLYAACWRAARAMGYKKAVTYTIPSESGASLRAAGWTVIGEAGGGSWNRDSRPRVDRHPTQEKIRWEVSGRHK